MECSNLHKQENTLKFLLKTFMMYFENIKWLKYKLYINKLFKIILCVLFNSISWRWEVRCNGDKEWGIWEQCFLHNSTQHLVLLLLIPGPVCLTYCRKFCPSMRWCSLRCPTFTLLTWRSLSGLKTDPLGRTSRKRTSSETAKIGR